MVTRMSKTIPAQIQLRCLTRALKNARYLQKVAPHVLPEKAAAEGFGTGIPIHILARLHRLRHDSAELKGYEAVADFLKENRMPVPGRTARDPLFNGTIHFVQVTFQTPSGNFVIPNADMNTVVQYGQHAIVPIAEYASQFGPTNVTVSSNIIPYSVNLPGTSYNDANVQGWVNDIVNRNSLSGNSCVVIVSPQGLTAPEVGGNAGYHGLANVPYVVLGVFAQNLTLEDSPDVYAMVVSHEIAEMVVDPNVDGANPEVCDPCDINCNNLTRIYFDALNNYLGANQASPPGGFSFSYYICAVVKPGGALSCPASASDCAYAPPSGVSGGLTKLLSEIAEVVQILFGVTNDGGGVVILPGGQIIHVPPGGPPDPIFDVLIEGMAEVLRAVAVNQVTAGSTNVQSRSAIEKASLQMARAAIQRMERTLAARTERQG